MWSSDSPLGPLSQGRYGEEYATGHEREAAGHNVDATVKYQLLSRLTSRAGSMIWVPFVEDEHTVFLKTIIPSRKTTKEYLGEESDDGDGR